MYNDESTVYFLSTHHKQNFSKMRKSFIEQNDIDKIRKENDSQDDNNGKGKAPKGVPQFDRIKSEDSSVTENHLQAL